MIKLPENTKLETQFERIGAFLGGIAPESSLELNDYEVMKRWATAHDLLVERKAPSKVVSLLMHTYQISKRTAYHDITYSRRIYATPAMSRDVAKGFMENLGMDLIERSVAAGDYKAARGFYSDLMKLYELHRPETETIDKDTLTPVVNVYLTPPEKKNKRNKGETHSMALALLQELAAGNDDDDDITDVDYDTQGDNAQ